VGRLGGGFLLVVANAEVLVVTPRERAERLVGVHQGHVCLQEDGVPWRDLDLPAENRAYVRDHFERAFAERASPTLDAEFGEEDGALDRWAAVCAYWIVRQDLGLTPEQMIASLARIATTIVVHARERERRLFVAGLDVLCRIAEASPDGAAVLVDGKLVHPAPAEPEAS